MTVINCNFNIPTFFFDLLITDLKQYIKEGTYKVRNEIETKRNQRKRNEMNKNEKV
jgi:hypothetical protein